MADPQAKVVDVPDIGVVAFPGDMEDAHVANFIKLARAKKKMPVATEESEHARQLKFAQPLDSAIPKLPDWANRPTPFMVDPERQRHLQEIEKLGENHPVAAGVIKGAGGVAEGLTSPANLALMAGAPQSKVLSSFFAMQAMRGAYKSAQEAQDAYIKGNNQEAAKYATEALLNAGMAGFAGHHAVKDIPVPEPVKQFARSEEGSVGSQQSLDVKQRAAISDSLSATDAYGQTFRSIYGDEDWEEMSEEKRKQVIEQNYEEAEAEEEEIQEQQKKDKEYDRDLERRVQYMDGKQNEVETLLKKLGIPYTSHGSSTYSRYLNIDLPNDESATIRISDHAPPIGRGGMKEGGYDYHDEADESLHPNDDSVNKIKKLLSNKGISNTILGVGAVALPLSQVKIRAAQVNPSTVKVKDPNGMIHYFPNQQAADNFKRAAGIQ